MQSLNQWHSSPVAKLAEANAHEFIPCVIVASGIYESLSYASLNLDRLRSLLEPVMEIPCPGAPLVLILL